MTASDLGDLTTGDLKFFVTANAVRTIKIAEESGWQCHLFGMDYYVLTPPKGQVPNWFWRWMQFLAFGNRWERVK